jgi:hypothetical protein
MLDDDIEKINCGLFLLGFAVDSRTTSEDTLRLKEIAIEVLAAESEKKLDDDLREALAWRAYDVLSALFLSEERTTMVHAMYLDSKLLEPLVPIIDEATLAFFRGYFAASLGTLFVALEQYLRRLRRWKPGDGDVKFGDLRKAVDTFPDSEWKKRAAKILEGIYERYEALSPPFSFFNRHGLLHGIRGPHPMDRMNCGRMFFLFDYLAAAESRGMRRSVVLDSAFQERLDIYSSCVLLGRERKLLRYE